MQNAGLDEAQAEIKIAERLTYPSTHVGKLHLSSSSLGVKASKEGQRQHPGSHKSIWMEGERG